MNTKSLSIIIPMYNVEDYLEQCVQSIINQKIDFEIIMVDDGSRDRSLTVAQEIAGIHSKITIVSQENKGLGGARNTGIRNAKGEYILFLDADDKIAENALPKLLNLAVSTDAEILEFAAIGINEQGKSVYKIANSSDKLMPGKLYYKSVRYMNSACNKLYKLSFLKQHHLFFKERIFIEDFEFNTRVFMKAEKVLATDILGAYFLQTSESITRNNDISKIKKMHTDISEVISITAELYKKDNQDHETTLFFKERLSFLTTTLFYQLYKRNASYEEVRSLKQNLLSKKIFFSDYKIHDQKKELFRKILVKNLYLYPVFHFIKKRI